MRDNIHFATSDNPRAVIESLPRNSNQPPSMRQYMEGFEDWFRLLPVLSQTDPLLPVKTAVSGVVMSALARAVVAGGGPLLTTPDAKTFRRVILAVEEPTANREGAEILVAQWGAGFTSPIHGHAAGLLHEEILDGKMLVHTYRHIRPGVVRPLRSDVVERGTLVSTYSAPDPRGERMGLVHNFTAIVPSVSLHFVPEHTRDGRDNRFAVEHFSDFDKTSVRQIDGNEGRQLQIGDVALVRSDNVPEYGDHFIVITGPVSLKPHGLRPLDTAIIAGQVASKVLDKFTPTGNTGLRLLKLDVDTTRRFQDFHGITGAQGRVVIFPKP